MRFKIFLPAVFAVSTLAASADDWRTRSIYQVLTDRFARTDVSTTAPCDPYDRIYCGGTYQGLIKQLDYIQGMGFTAIWISPVTYNLLEQTADGSSYHGYWQQDLYRLNANFGSVDDLVNLSQELHDREMYLMVDVVTNHNGWAGNYTTVDYSVFNPFNDSKYYHPYCAIDYSNQTSTEDCWAGSSNVELVDLKTEDDTVLSMYKTWITSLVTNYSIDGLRIDSAKAVDKPFFPPFVEAAGVFTTGEVLTADANYTCDYQNYIGSVLNYPLFYPINSTFAGQESMSALVDMLNTEKGSSPCPDDTVLGTFSENHDQPRFGSYTSDLALAKNVLTTTVMTDGIPIVYYGQEQFYNGSGDPTNRAALWLSGYDTSAPLYILTAQLNQIRNYAIAKNSSYVEYKNWVVYSDDSTAAIRKGFDGAQVVSVLSNVGSSGSDTSYSIENTGFAAGATVVEVLSCGTVTVDGSGNLPVNVSGGLPGVFYAQDGLSGSGICGY